MSETQVVRRGHRFLPPADERAKIPDCYAQDGINPPDKIVYAHYFGGSFDFWVTELWEDENDPGQWWAFGYTRFAHMPDGAEWGYQHLNALEKVVLRPDHGLPLIIERDLHWTPRPMWQCERSGVYDSHGYKYIVLRGEHLNWSQQEIAKLCRKAHEEQAPKDAALRFGREWWSAYEAPMMWRRVFGLADRLPADDIDLEELGYPYIVKFKQSAGEPPAFIASLCRKAQRIGAPDDTYALDFTRRYWFTVDKAPPEVRNILGLPALEDDEQNTSEPEERTS